VSKLKDFFAKLKDQKVLRLVYLNEDLKQVCRVRQATQKLGATMNREFGLDFIWAI